MASLVDSWLASKHELLVAQERERELRAQLIDSCDLRKRVTREGTHHCEVDDGRELTMQVRKLMSVKDTAKLEKFLDASDNPEVYDAVFLRKYSVDKAAHGKLSDERKKAVKSYLHVTTASPQLKLKEEK